MKPLNVQIKNDTKRLLRGQTCDTCLKAFISGNTIVCRYKNRYVLVPLVHTCYKYESSRIYQNNLTWSHKKLDEKY